MPYVIRDENGDVSAVARWPVDGAGEEIIPDDDPEVLDFKRNRELREHPEPAVKNPLAALLIKNNILTPQEVNDAFGYVAPPPRPPRTSDATVQPARQSTGLAKAAADRFDPMLALERLTTAALTGGVPDLPADQIAAINARRAARGEPPV